MFIVRVQTSFLSIIIATAATGGVASAQSQGDPPPGDVALPPGDPQIEPHAPPPETPTPKKRALPVSVSYDGGATLNSDDGTFQLKLNGNLQTRWEWNFTEGGDNTQRFMITRARIAISGFVFTKTQYKLEYALSDQGYSRLRDFYVNQVFADGGVQVRAGQFKRPFNRQEIESDFVTEFVEKANTLQWIGAEGGQRDLGLMVSNGIERSPDGIEYAAGLFNGQGENLTIPSTCTVNAMTNAVTCVNGTPTNTPADWQPMVVGRIGYNYGGIKGYSEGDFEGGPFRLAVAASYRGKNLQDKATAPIEHDFEADFMAKIEGFDATGTFFIRKPKGTGANAEFLDTQVAFHVQAGYMIVPKTIHVALRFSEIPDAYPAAGADQTYDREYRVALNYFVSHNHSWKCVGDFGFLKDSVDGSKYRLNFRTGVQLVF